MEKQRAERNRTISLTETETDLYLSKCVRLTQESALSDITDTIVHGDALNVIDYLPVACVDLLIVDPPYNLNKTFNNTTFKQMSDVEYAAFTENWILKVKRVLKDTASLYVCCDWRTSLIIGSVLQRHFTVQNRITWQREKGRGAKRNWKNSMEDIWFATMSPKSFTYCFAFDKNSCDTGGSKRGDTAANFEADVFNEIIFNLYIESHGVAAAGISSIAYPIRIFHFTGITRVGEMIYHFICKQSDRHSVTLFAALVVMLMLVANRTS